MSTTTMHKTVSPDNSDGAIEQLIVAKGKTAARVTPADIEAAIASRQFHVFPGSQLTVCVLTLRNGFTVTGESACASPENFDAEIGERVAFDNAKQKIWPLLGYVLKEQLYAATKPFEPGTDGARYTGTKTLRAWPMTRGAYNEYRAWPAPAGEDQTVDGYLVEYEDGGAANDSRHAGYISWTPADVFQRSYRAA